MKNPPRPEQPSPVQASRSTRIRHTHILLAALAAALAMCAHYPMMALFRGQVLAKYSVLVRAWPHDGSFAVLGGSYPFLPEEAIYAARARTAAAHILPYDPLIRENHRARMISNDFLVYFVMGLVQRLIGNIEVTWTLIRFAAAGSWFYLLFLLARHTTRAPELSICFAAFVTFYSYILTGMFLYAVPWSELATVKGLLRSGWVLASYGRTESLLRLPRPGIAYAALFAAFLAMIRALNGKPDIRRPALFLAGAAAGLLAYVHFDVWTTQVGATLVLGAIESRRRKRALHPLWIPAATALVVSLPWFALNVPADPELLARAATFSRAPDLYSFVFLAGFFIGLRGLRRAPSAARLALTAFLGSMFLILNVQIVTGYSIERDHWYWFGNIFLALFALSFLKERWRAQPRLWLAAAALLLAATFAQNSVYAALHFPSHGQARSRQQALRWLAENAATDSVVASLDKSAIAMIAASTPCKSLVAYGNPAFSDIPQAENIARLRRAVSLYGLPWDDYLHSIGLDRHAYRPGNYFFFGPTLPLETARGLLATAAPGQGFRTDYLWVGPFERTLLGKPLAAAPEPVFRSGDYALYRLEAGAS